MASTICRGVGSGQGCTGGGEGESEGKGEEPAGEVSWRHGLLSGAGDAGRHLCRAVRGLL